MSGAVAQFREMMVNAITNLSKSDSVGATYAKNIVQTLLDDFNDLLPSKLFDHPDMDEIEKLIKEHCYSEDKCPICGSGTRVKRGKFGEFKGCIKYPRCQGSRGTDGQPTINEALLEFLAEEDRRHRMSKKTSRLSKVDI